MIKIKNPFVHNRTGNGFIRFKKDGRYYHGMGKKEWLKFNKNFGDNELPIMFEYSDKNRRLPNPCTWDTHTISDLCKCHKYDSEKSRRKRTHKIFRCRGHSISSHSSNKLRSSFMAEDANKNPKWNLCCALGCTKVPRYRKNKDKLLKCSVCNRKLKFVSI